MRKTFVVPAVAAAVTMLAAGCGSSSDGSSSVSMGASGIDNLRSIFQHAAESKQTVEETINLGGSGPDGETETCKIRLHPTTAADCTTPGGQGAGAMHIITLPDGVYESETGPDADQAGGKPWHKSPGSDAMAQIGLTQPAGDGNIFTPGAGKVTGSASDTVDGKSCTRYNISLDINSLVSATLKRADGSSNDSADAAAAMSQVTNGGSASGQVWIGNDGLPVQTVVSLTFKDQPTQTQTYKYSDWGTDVSVSAPPADQVAVATPN